MASLFLPRFITGTKTPEIPHWVSTAALLVLLLLFQSKLANYQQEEWDLSELYVFDMGLIPF